MPLYKKDKCMPLKVHLNDPYSKFDLVFQKAHGIKGNMKQ